MFNIHVKPNFAEYSYPSSPYVSTDDQVYEFLSAAVVRGIIPVSAITVRPLSRSEIGGMLQTISERYRKLSDRILEADLNYYLREFASDIARVGAASKPRRRVRSVRKSPVDAFPKPHWHVADWSMDNLNFVFDPIIKVDWNDNGSKTIFRRATGIQFRGVIQNQVGFFFKFTDNLESGDGPYLNRDDLLEDQYGYVGPLMGGDETYYDINNAYIAKSWSKFSVVFGKDNFAWGLDNNELLFSGEAPPFTQVRLKANLTSKIQFSYVLGKLNSWSAPGDTIYTTENNWERIIPADKWVVGHRLDYSPVPRINLSVSEALIWGDRGLEFSYLNPLAFLFSAEHDGGDLDNVLLSGDITIQLNESMIWSASLLIDDMNTANLGTGDFGNKFAWSTGLSAIVPWVDGVRTSLSYQKVDPFVYSHFFPVNRFTNWTSSLGSSLDPNSDKWNYQIIYKPIRKLKLKLDLQHIRHGEFGGSLNETITKGENPLAKFLIGYRTDWTRNEISIEYEPLPALIISAGRIKNDMNLIFEDRYFLFFGYRY